MHEVERRAEVVHLAAALVERAGARADAAEVEAQHRAADPRQRLRRLIHRLRVHRAAVLGCGCANTTAARTPSACPALTQAVSADRCRPAAGSSSSASSRPAGPAISRSADQATLPARRRRRDELADDRRRTHRAA